MLLIFARTVQMKGVWTKKMPKITGVAPGHTFNFENVHIHWSTRDDAGSEHRLFGRK